MCYKISLCWLSILYIVVKVTEKAVATHSSTLAWKSHGWRSLVGCSPWGREELDTTEWLHVHFSLSCIGEGNGNPHQCSCLESPRDGGAWWAAVYEVAQSWTRLKRLSSSSSSSESKSVSCSVLSDSVIPWTATCQAPWSMEFSRQEYWSGLSFPSPRIVVRNSYFILKSYWGEEWGEFINSLIAD